MYLRIQALRGGGAEVAGGRVVGNQVGSHAVTWLALTPLFDIQSAVWYVYKSSVESTSWSDLHSLENGSFGCAVKGNLWTRLYDIYHVSNIYSLFVR